jgi:hypothetical protein
MFIQKGACCCRMLLLRDVGNSHINAILAVIIVGAFPLLSIRVCGPDCCCRAGEDFRSASWASFSRVSRQGGGTSPAFVLEGAGPSAPTARL